MSWITALVGAASLAITPVAGDGGVSTFYSWTSRVPVTPGKLLRQEPMQTRLTKAAKAQRFLYSGRSGYGAGGPVTVSGSYYLPAGKAPKGGWPVIAWAHGTTGAADVCAPSWMGWSPRDVAYLDGWLAQGYAVVATDYEGLGTPGPHAYMALRSEARSVLDSIRAARAADPSLSARTVIVGQSQGAHAALGAGLLAPTYAPQIDLRGVVATGVPNLPVQNARADLGDVMTDGVKTIPPDRFDPWIVVYLAYFGAYDLFETDFKPEDYLTTKGASYFHRLQRECHAAVTPNLFKGKPLMSEIFTRDPAPVERKMVVNRIYPEPKFAAPVFIGIGLQDEQTAPEGAFAFAQSACRRGSKVTVRYYPGQSHSGTVLLSQKDSSGFVSDVFAGRPPAGDCAGLSWPRAKLSRRRSR